jgi:hypothetical protein
MQANRIKSVIMFLFWTVLGVLLCGQISSGQQTQVQVQVQAGANASAANANLAGAAAKSVNQLSPEQRRFEEFRKSPYFMEPFDPKVLSLPDEHLAIVRANTRKDKLLYKEIVDDAIKSRNKLAPSVRLLLKYSAKILTGIIKNRIAEKQAKERVDPKPEYFLMIVDLAQQVVDVSAKMKSKYSKSTLDIENFRLRAESMLDYFEQIIDASPLGGYMKWNQMVFYKDRPRNGIQNRPFMEELPDLVAVSSNRLNTCFSAGASRITTNS